MNFGKKYSKQKVVFVEDDRMYRMKYADSLMCAKVGQCSL